MASTSALVNAAVESGRDWNRDIIRSLGYPEKIFKPLRKAGDRIGILSKAVADEVGFSCMVTLPATHDTGSAFLAVPAAPDETPVYISSGTWSLLGMETESPIITAEGQRANFSNEGGYQYRYRFLKNIMGLWMVQSVRNELGGKCSFAELEKMAREAASFPARLNVNDPAFLSPASMIDAVKDAVRQSGQQVPESPGEIIQCLYASLAASYREAVLNMEKITGRSFSAINLVGGGSKDEYLNRLTAQVTGLPVYTGPVEATVIGNIIVQMISGGVLQDLSSARAMVSRSFTMGTYK
jgi:rhamnulokinase